MKRSSLLTVIFFASLALAVVWLMPGFATANGTQATCDAFATGSIPDLSSLQINFDCDAPATVYFGACDSGGVPNDDLFNITYGGAVVASNSYVGGVEFVNIGSAMSTAGTNVATLNSLSQTAFPPATFSYAISTNMSAVSAYLGSFCGTDFAGTGPAGDCTRTINIFTADTAPTDGKLTLNVRYGTQNRYEGIALMTWNVLAGQRLNNVPVTVPAPEYARLWWQPAGDSNWYLLTSQYWTGDGTEKSEFGVSCGSAPLPSYHTAFSTALATSSIPLFTR